MPEPADRKTMVISVGAIVLATAAAYANSFHAALVFDDGASIAENATIHKLWPLATVLSPPANGATVSGRPLLNLSFALNYAWGGLNVQGYHLTNLAIHLLAGLTLFGITRRTLLGISSSTEAPAVNPTLVAGIIALLWCVHPLQTESVTYLSQRAESLMGLWYLVALYGFIRGTESAHPAGWYLVAIGACVLGMATKEVMASAPLIIFLYDRTFVAGSFRQAWKCRWAVHVSLASSWFVLAALVTGAAARGGTAGFGTTMAWPAYITTQLPAICHYLWLSFWPTPLIFGWGAYVASGLWPIATSGAFVLALAAGCLFALRYSPRWGFLGAWFFAILAPSSSIVPIATETVAEHRMYLPLAAVLAAAVLALYSWLGSRCLPWLALAAVGLTVLTVRRNADYRSNFSLWGDTVMKQPNNPLARFNFGVALTQRGDTQAATAQYEEAVKLKADYPEALLNLGNCRMRAGRTFDAIHAFQQALKFKSPNPEACCALGMALFNSGHPAEGIHWLQEALRLRPDFTEAHHNLGLVFAHLGRQDEALGEFRSVVRSRPADGESFANLGLTLAYFGRIDEAVSAYNEALKLQPDSAEIHRDLGNALLKKGLLQEATEHFQAARLLEKK